MKVSEYTKINKENIDLKCSFMEYGFDSANIVKFVGELERDWNIKLDITTLIDYPNLKELNEYLNKCIDKSSQEQAIISDCKFNDKIAIIGMACRFPGANNVEQFYENIKNEVCSVEPCPKERVNLIGRDINNKKYSQSIYNGGYIQDIEYFDNNYFNISHEEAEFIDPQQRILMQEIVHALEDAHITLEDNEKKRIGVFVGASNYDYSRKILGKNQNIYSITGNSLAMLSNRMSYIFNFRGPSMTIDTACSSSLVAVCEAMEQLNRNACDVAVVAGVNLILDLDINTAFAEVGMLSNDGLCHTFDEKANGYVRGEGIGVVILKKEKEAIINNDHIYTLILGKAINQDGKSASLTAPNKNMQVELIKKACISANISPCDLNYIEAHGTGTMLGDVIEVNAINEAVNNSVNRKNSLLIGSVKTNIGHLESAAGIAALIKNAYCLDRKTLVPSINFKKANPKLELDCRNIEVIRRNVFIDNSKCLCGISSFGFGGTNCHIILENSEWRERKVDYEHGKYYLIPFTAATLNALWGKIDDIKRYLESNKDIDLKDLEYVLTQRSEFKKYRVCYVVEDVNELIKKITKSLNNKLDVEKVRNNNVAFLFSGQGTQWIGMAQGLEKYSVYNEWFERCRRKFKEIGHGDIMELLQSNEKSVISESYNSQPLIFSIQVSLAKLLNKVGIDFKCVCGHSLGEVAAAYVSGALSLDSAVRIIHYRSEILSRFTGKGKMLSVSLNEQKVKKYIDGYENVSIGVINDRNIVVVSGELPEIEYVRNKLQKENIECSYLPVNYAFHYSGLKKYKTELIDKIGAIKTKPITSKFISTVKGDVISTKELNGHYWADNMIQTVRFSQASQKLCDYCNTVIEIAPSTALLGYLPKLDDINFSPVSIQKRRVNPQKAFLEAIGDLFKIGFDINWRELNLEEGNLIKLPAYRFDRNYCWIDNIGDNNEEISKEQEINSVNYSIEEIRDITLDLISDMLCCDKNISLETLIEDLGMDSLMKFQINVKFNKIFGISLSYEEINGRISILDIVDKIYKHINLKININANDSLGESSTDELVTDGQASIIYDQIANSESNKYNMSGAWKLDESIYDDVWVEAYESVINKYYVFKSVFFRKGRKIIQKFRDNMIRITKINLDRNEDLSTVLNNLLNAPFDLSKEAIRGVLASKDDKIYFGLSIHHCIIDGISFYNLLKEIISVYNRLINKENVVLLNDKSYLKYQINSKKYKNTDQYELAKQYWKNEFNRHKYVRNFKTSNKTDKKGSSEQIRNINENLFDNIKKYSKKNKLTLFEILYRTYQILYYKITNEKKFITCTYSSGRDEPEFYETMGYFVKNIIDVCEINSSNTAIEYMQQMHKHMIETYKYQGISMTELLDISDENILTGPDHVFVYEKAPELVEGSPIFISNGKENEKFTISSFQFEKVHLQCIDAQYDLVFMVEECKDCVVLRCQYKEAIYDEKFINQLIENYICLLSNIIGNENQPLSLCEIVDSNLKQSILYKSKNNVSKKLKGILYHQYIEKYAFYTPKNLAVIYGETCITYEQLNNESNLLARKIYSFTNGKNIPIGVAVEKSIEFLISIFAIMKAGAYYVPLDKNYPIDRLQYIINNSTMKYVITNETFQDIKLDFSKVTIIQMKREYCDYIPNINLDLDLSSIAYVIYTSGSTGKPKGVEIMHRGIENIVLEQKRIFNVTENDRVNFFASVCFDASIFEILMAIGHGATLCFDKREYMGTGEKLRRYLEKNRISIITLPSSVLASMENRDLDNLQIIITAGEPCSMVVKDKWVSNHRFFNAYGVTEVSIWNTISECYSNKKIDIGTPISNHEILILNEDKNLCPVGVIGEMYIGGIGVGKGYIDLDHQTEEKFVNLFGDGRIFYRTGDLVKQDYCGEIEYIGRCDNQIKVRGFRIELEEIEKVIQSYEKIINTTVVIINNNGTEQLVCFLETKEKEDEEYVIRLRTYIKRILPQYMIPDRFFMIDKWLLNQNGKIDRKAMLGEALKNIENREIIKASSEEEINICNIITKCLDITQISMSDSLIALGMNSIKAYNLIADIEERFGTTLPINKLLDNITVKELIELIREESHIGYELMIKPDDESIILSDNQKGLWIDNKINRGSSKFNIPLVLKIDGKLKIDKINEAFNYIIEKHNILKTKYYSNGNDVRGEVIEAFTYNFDFTDISLLDDDYKKKMIYKIIKEMKCINLTPDSFPMFHGKIVKVSENKFYFMLTMHHFIVDGWSFKIILEELKKYYSDLCEGKKIIKEKLEYQYEDIVYSINNHNNKYSKDRERYWIEKLNNKNYRVNLPEDYTRPHKITHVGRSVSLEIVSEDFRKICDFTHKHSITNFSLMVSVLGILLEKYSGQSEITIGFPMLCRENKFEREVIGMFVDTGILKLNINPELKFSDFLNSVCLEILQTYENSKIGLNRIIELINPERMPDTTPLFQVMINMMNFDMNTKGFGDLDVYALDDEVQEAKYDLTFYITENSDSYSIKLNYYADVYKGETARHMLDMYSYLLSEIIDNDNKYLYEYSLNNNILDLTYSESLNYVKDEKLNRSFVENTFNMTNNIFIDTGNENISYEYITNEVIQISNKMRQYGVNKKSCIAIKGKRSPMLIKCILAVLENSAIYVILDQEWPEERMKVIMKQCDCTHFMEFINNDIEIKNIKSTIGYERTMDSSYIGVTSGTTGIPKCILGHNSAVNHFINWEINKFNLNSSDRFSILSGISHDPILRDIFVPIKLGATIVFPKNEKLIENDLFKYLRDGNITVANITPSIAEIIIMMAQKHSGEILNELRFLFLGGEILKKSVVKEMHRIAPNCRIINYYGSTETPQGMSWIEYDLERLDIYPENLPIGQGIEDVEILIMDKYKNILTTHELGMIAIRTPYLSKGYINTSDKEDNFIDENIYITGDIGRYRLDGTIDVLGRKDSQIKRYGHRIELEEIETNIKEYKDVRSAVVLFYKDNIYAFVVTNKHFDVTECYDYLCGRLASYMLPTSIIKIEQIPITSNGKTDRTKLESYIKKQNETKHNITTDSKYEKMVRDVWVEVLQKDNFSNRNTFFESGGNSMKILILRDKMEAKLQKEIDIAKFFDYPTIESFSKYLNQKNIKLNIEDDMWNKAMEKSKKANSVFEIRKNRKRKR